MSANRYAGLIIRDNHNRFLTLKHLKRADKPWGFAGGKIENNELPIVAAARELYEELGAVALSLSFYATTEVEIAGKVWTGHWYQLGQYAGDFEIQEPNKHSEMMWLTADELVQFGAIPEAELVKLLGGK